jgi:IPT/TIG domain
MKVLILFLSTIYSNVGITVPSITSLSPNHGPVEGGTQFVIEGENFGPSQDKITVFFDGNELSGCTLVTPHTAIECTSPPKEENNEAPIKVNVDGQDSEPYPPE